MKNKFTNIAIAVFIVLLNFIYIFRAYDVGKVYPFDRLSFSNRMLFPITFFDRNIPIGSEVLFIDNIPIKDNELIPFLLKKKEMPALVYYKKNDATKIMNLPFSAFKTDFFAFFLFLIFFADVHILWGLVARYFNRNSITALFYYHFSVVFGFFLFSLVDAFLFQRFGIFQYISSLALAFEFLVLSINILTIRNLEKVTRTLYLIFIILIPIVWIVLGRFTLLFQMKFLFTLINISTFLAFLSYILKIVSNFKFLWRISLVTIVTHLISLVYPIIYLQKSLYSDFQMPITFAFSFTILLPMFVGTNIVMEGIGRINIFRKSYFLRFLINAIVGIGGAIVFYIALHHGFPNISTAVSYATAIVFLVLLLYIRKEFFSYLRKSFFWFRDESYISIQRIAEIAASPYEAKNRVEAIFSEIRNMMKIKHLRFYLFEQYFDEKIDGLEYYIEYLPKTRLISKYYKKYRGIINRYTMYSGCVFDYIKRDFNDSDDIDFIFPVSDEKNIIALFAVGNRESQMKYLEAEIKYLQGAAILIYQLIYNEILLKNYILRRKFEKELDIASYVQLRLFPKKVPLDKGLNISFYNRPYVKVSGDFFDFIDLNKEEAAIIIGDVAGHGLQASMVLAVVSTLIYSMFKAKKTIEEVFDEINNFLTERYSGIELITLFIGIYNKKSDTLDYINAGHPIPIKMTQEGEISYLEKRSQILGALSEAEYKKLSIKLKKGDQVFLYTDGIVEIKNEKTSENMGESELLKILLKNKEKNIEDKLEAFTNYIDSFNAEVLDDDITIIAFEVE